jgi:hypothetical protein
VEMRAGVVGLVPVHEDRDAVEEADPGHPVTVRARPEGVLVRAGKLARISPASRCSPVARPAWRGTILTGSA